MATNFDRVGSEIQVNVTGAHDAVTNTEYHPDIAALADGRFLVTYTRVSSSLNTDIYGQFINADGTLSGLQFDIDNSSAIEDNSSLALRAGGGAVVTYEDDSNGGLGSTDIHLRLLTSTGTNNGEYEVAGYVTSGIDTVSDLAAPDVATLTNGRSLVVWESDLSGTNHDIHARLFNPTGFAFDTGLITIDSSTGSVSDRPAVAAAGNNALVAYEDTRSGGNTDIRAVLFNGTTNTAGASVVIADQAESLHDVDVTVLSDGRFVVVYDNDTTGNVFARIVAANGNPVGSEIIVAGGSGDQDNPRVAPLADGGFIVTWDDNGGSIPPDNSGGPDHAIHARRFLADGTPGGDEFLVNTATNGHQVTPAIAVNGTGHAFLAWEDGGSRPGDTLPSGVRGGAFQTNTDIVNGTPGPDVLATYNLSEVINGLAGNDTLRASGGNDVVHGDTGIDTLFGGDGNDRMFGDDGLDTLKGDAGDDILAGGAGRDRLEGGPGRDIFDFNAPSDSRGTGNGCDVILLFSEADGDRIDLRTIDANTDSPGNQRFHFIGAATFHHHPGELRIGAGGFVEGDVDGGGRADLSIRVQGHIGTGDFLL